MAQCTRLALKAGAWSRHGIHRQSLSQAQLAQPPTTDSLRSQEAVPGSGAPLQAVRVVLWTTNVWLN